MQVEITKLVDHHTWDVMLRDDIKPVEYPDGKIELPQVIPSTWAYQIKRKPDGKIEKFNAQFCIHGDLQEEATDVFEKYSPVSSWTSI